MLNTTKRSRGGQPGPAHPKWKGRKAIRQTPLYRLWLAIRNRCNNPRGQDYKYYGGRGIQVCPAWDSYDQFAFDVGPHPGGGLTLDRRNNNGDYEPGNVRWATRQTQARNRPGYNTLNKTLADEIRSLYATGQYTQKELGALYGVTQVSVSQITRGERWI